MGEHTGIGWTNSTWNPWLGCRKVSAGCTHCYAEKLVNGRMGGNFSVVRRTQPATFNLPLRWQREALAKGERRFVFSCSLSDFFIEEADAWRADAWDIVRRTPNLTYQILTKRPERIAANLPQDWGHEGYANVWLGVSGETTAMAFHRGKILHQVPARIRFLSAEPWLEDTLIETIRVSEALERWDVFRRFDWVILGGESGPGFRPMNMESARQIRDACAMTGTPLYLKQLGGHPDKRDHEKAVLDGRTWTQMPVVA